MQIRTKYIKITALLVLIMLGLGSCEDSFLEVKPKGKLIADKTWDYDLLLNNRDLVDQISTASIVLGDEIAAIQPEFQITDLHSSRSFKWEDVIYDNDEDADEMKQFMIMLYCYNKIINEVMDSEGGTEEEKKSIRAQALAGRANTYLWLINFYGKPYNEVSSATDPGFPIITESDITLNDFTRASVKDVYDFIVNDLVEAIPDLPHMDERMRPSDAFAKALLGKTYMYMGKFNEALPLFNGSIADLSNATVPVGLYDYNVEFSDGGAFLPIGFFGPEYPTVESCKESMLGFQMMNGWSYVWNELVLPPQTVALYDNSDLRLNWFRTTYFPFGNLPEGFLRRCSPMAVYVGFNIPDLYLYRAECKARLNELPEAVEDLETLRKHRMPQEDAIVPVEIASQQLDLIKFILDERIREFALQGYRWFDMRRLSVDPLFSGATYTHVIYTVSGEIETTYTLSPERLTLRFPQKVMDQNPGMENNP